MVVNRRLWKKVKCLCGVLRNWKTCYNFANVIQGATDATTHDPSTLKQKDYCIDIIVDFLNDNNVNTIDFTEIKDSDYKAFYWRTQFRSLDNNHFVNDRVISLKKETDVIKVYTEGNIFFFREGIMRNDDIDTIYWSVKVDVIHAVVYLLEYLANHFSIERKAVFVPKRE